VPQNEPSHNTLQALRRLVLDEVDTGTMEPGTARLVLDPTLRVDTSPYVDATLTAKVAMLENIVSRIHGPWEPDGITGEDLSGHDTPPMPRGQVADTSQTDSPAQDDAGPAVAVDQLSPQEMEVLRQMISGIIYDELSGAFGEAITENLRQMVRREIKNVLAEKGVRSDPNRHL